MSFLKKKKKKKSPYLSLLYKTKVAIKFLKKKKKKKILDKNRLGTERVKTLTLSLPSDVNYVLEQGQGYGHLSKYLISGLIFHFFHVYMKKNFKPFSKKRSLDISLQHKNLARYKLKKKKLLYFAENRAGAERVKRLKNNHFFTNHRILKNKLIKFVKRQTILTSKIILIFAYSSLIPHFKSKSRDYKFQKTICYKCNIIKLISSLSSEIYT